MADRTQPDELSRIRAYAEAPDVALTIDAMATQAEATDSGRLSFHKQWTSDARCHTMHMHLALTDVHDDALEMAATALYRSAELGQLPWYDDALSGEVLHVISDDPPAIAGRGVFDLGLRSPRSYVQLASRHLLTDDRTAIVLRSIADRSPDPVDAVRAFMLAPSGDVVTRSDDGRLHWHHIVTTPGPRMFPGPLDRWIVALVRSLGVSRKELATYRREANGFEAMVRDIDRLRSIVHTRLSD